MSVRDIFQRQQEKRLWKLKELHADVRQASPLTLQLICCAAKHDYNVSIVQCTNTLAPALHCGVPKVAKNRTAVELLCSAKS